MRVAESLVRQLGDPTGRVGRLVGRVLNRANRRINQGALDVLDVAVGHRVLDVGFGGGVALAMLLEQTQASCVLGVERSDEMVSDVRKRHRADLDAGRLELHLADVGALPLESQSVDRALTVNTVYFWTDAVAALRELHRVLAPGGRLVIAVRPKEVLQRSRVASRHFRLYGEEDLVDLLQQAGFGHARCERRERSLFAMGDIPQRSP